MSQAFIKFPFNRMLNAFFELALCLFTVLSFFRSMLYFILYALQYYIYVVVLIVINEIVKKSYFQRLIKTLKNHIFTRIFRMSIIICIVFSHALKVTGSCIIMCLSSPRWLSCKHLFQSCFEQIVLPLLSMDITQVLYIIQAHWNVLSLSLNE